MIVDAAELAFQFSRFVHAFTENSFSPYMCIICNS